MVNFPLFFDGDVSPSTSYGVYILQHIRFAGVSIHLNDFNLCDMDCLPSNKLGIKFEQKYKIR